MLKERWVQIPNWFVSIFENWHLKKKLKVFSVLNNWSLFYLFSTSVENMLFW